VPNEIAVFCGTYGFETPHQTNFTGIGPDVARYPTQILAQLHPLFSANAGL
jgi:hypothetical protein